MAPFDISSFIMGYESGLQMAADNNSEQNTDSATRDPEDASETDEEPGSDN